MAIGIEICPPRTAQDWPTWESMCDRLPIDPQGRVSLTMPAAVDGPARTLEGVARLARRGWRVTAHATASALHHQDAKAWIAQAHQAGASALLALQGDGPLTGAPGVGAGRLARFAADLGMEVAVAAHPDPHPHSQGLAADVRALGLKHDAGARIAITQAVFDSGALLRLRDALAQASVGLTIVAGIAPVHDWTKMETFARRCGAHVPDAFARACAEAADPAEEANRRLAAMAALLAREGVGAVQIFSLNKPAQAHAFLERLARARAGDVGGYGPHGMARQPDQSRGSSPSANPHRAPHGRTDAPDAIALIA